MLAFLSKFVLYHQGFFLETSLTGRLIFVETKKVFREINKINFYTEILIKEVMVLVSTDSMYWLINVKFSIWNKNKLEPVLF